VLTFLGVEALAEAFERQSALPRPLAGAGIVLLGVAASYLAMTFLGARLSRRGEGAAVGAAALALLVAIGIGVHNFGEGLAIGTSFAVGELTLGSFLIIGFMIHNITEGLGIAAPAAKSRARLRLPRLAALALIGGGPAILGAWLGGFVSSDFLAVLFFAAAAGAALEVVVEVGRYVGERMSGGLRSGWVVGGFLSGIGAMYVTGLLAA
jgi:zinc transporter, ZIP family